MILIFRISLLTFLAGISCVGICEPLNNSEHNRKDPKEISKKVDSLMSESVQNPIQRDFETDEFGMGVIFPKEFDDVVEIGEPAVLYLIKYLKSEKYSIRLTAHHALLKITQNDFCEFKFILWRNKEDQIMWSKGILKWEKWAKKNKVKK